MDKVTGVVTITHGEFKWDDDGGKDKHLDKYHQNTTSGTMDKAGNIVAPGDHPGTKSLIANTQPYGVVAGDIAKMYHIHIGDKETITFANGTVVRVQIGDIGPSYFPRTVTIKKGKDKGKTKVIPGTPPGEASIAAGDSVGLKHVDKGHGIGPVSIGNPGIVSVTYAPGTRQKPKW